MEHREVLHSAEVFCSWNNLFSGPSVARCNSLTFHVISKLNTAERRRRRRRRRREEEAEAPEVWTEEVH
jgi:hypothetical protein